MLGIRLDARAELQLAQYARESGRPKSAIARDWIIERLERESIDEQMRRAAFALRDIESQERMSVAEAMSSEWIHARDIEDGGYDWGPKGEPH